MMSKKKFFGTLILLIAILSSFVVFQTSILRTDTRLLSALSPSLPFDNKFDSTLPVNITTSPNYFDGYNLFVLENINMATQQIIEQVLYITDMKGTILYQKKVGSTTFPDAAFYVVEFIDSKTVICGIADSVILLNIETNEVVDLGFNGHHEYELNPVNDTYFTLIGYQTWYEDQPIVFDKVREYDSDGNIVWEASTWDYVSLDQWCPFEDKFDIRVDLTHTNTIIFDDKEDVLYINCRNTNTFYKIDHKTGDLLWSLGEYGNFTLRDINGNIRDTLFYHSHALEIVDKDIFIIFDNDYHNQTNALNEKSRMVEITIDEETFTANVTWEWTAPKEYYSSIWGDADRLPNSNRLGCFGTRTHGEFEDISARLVEVNDTGKIVWEMNFPKKGDIAYGIYRVERFSFSPYVDIDSNLWIKSDTEAKFDLRAFYNFRNKYEITGSYTIELDGNIIEIEDLTFPRYWHPAVRNITLGFLDDGEYNLRITVQDAEGHKTIKDVMLIVSETEPDFTEVANFVFYISAIAIFILIPLMRKKPKPKLERI